LIDGALTSEQQCSALTGLALRAQPSEPELHALRQIGEQHLDVVSMLGRETLERLKGTPDIPSATGPWLSAMEAVLQTRPLGNANIQSVINDIVKDGERDHFAAALLMAIAIKGLQSSDVESLTQAMALSGDQYDYRDEPALAGARLIRRYPTGALSEKTALILPALICASRRDANVCSPFLVAKSLGHTGGTWDKLSSIPGFQFPEPGERSVATLAKCGVAMVVTHGNVNPADRKLYQLRSAIGAVESPPLIISSIASKQLCFPVHRFLLDVRIGVDSFLTNEAEGIHVGRTIDGMLRRVGIASSFTLTAGVQPTGTAIGNAMEVAEAIAVMGGEDSFWDRRGILEQRLLVIDFFAKLMAAEFPQRSASEWARFASNQFESGAVLAGFECLLVAHGVTSSIASQLRHDALRTLSVHRHSEMIGSNCSGVIRRLDQIRLGGIIYHNLGAGGNQFAGMFDPRVGLKLAIRLGDIVSDSDPLCWVFTAEPISVDIRSAIESCFHIN
jgi:thymidine phosphorylase